MKKLFSLMFVMLAIIMPMKLWAQEPYAVLTTDSATILSQDSTGVTYGKTLTFYYDGQKTARNGMDVKRFDWLTDRGWNDDAANITSVVFDDSFANDTTFTHMGNWFSNFVNLTQIEGIKNLKTQNVTYMGGMFSSCAKLSSLDLSGFNTSKVFNMQGMFRGCSSLKSVDVSSFNTANVINMYGMFAECPVLTDVDVSGFNTTKVTDMALLFYECNALTTVDVSGFNTENVTDMYAMFCRCLSLKSVDVSHFNTEKVTDMHEMFAGCPVLESLDVSNFNTSNVESMYYMFNSCKALKELDLSSFDMTKVTNMEGMFSFCQSLEKIVVEYNWDTSSITSGNSVFHACYNLVGGMGTTYDANRTDYTYAHIDGGPSNPGYFTDKNAPAVAEPYAVISNGNTVLTFYYDDKKTERDGLSVGPFSNMLEKGWGDYMNMVIMNVVFDASFANCTTLTSTADWFSGCSYLTTITGIEYLNTDNVTNMNRMFYGCSHLTTLDISNFNTSNVTDMAEMFGGCSGLTTLNVSNFNTSNVTNMSSMFSNCSGLTSLDVSNFNTSNVTNMNSMFDNCSGLTSLDIRNFNTPNVTDMGAMFYGCSGLISLDLSNLNTDSVTVMKWMFTGCSGLTTIDLSKFNTSKVTEMSRMFEGCSSLTSLELNNFNTSTAIHMDKMFMGCSSLASLDLSHFETPLLIDVNSMFRDAAALTTIYVGDSWDMTYVSNGADMFTGCTNLVGGNGTVYDANHIDHTYAHIDGGASNPGYFTAKNQETDNKFSTCAEVGAGEDGKTYRVKGRVKSISNTTFGNWYIEDATDSLYIFGTVDYVGRYPRDGMSWESYGINVGDTVTVQGPKSTYKGVPELVDVRVLSPITLLNVSSNDTAMIAMINRESIRLAPNAATVTAKLYYAGSNCEVTIPDHAQSWLTLQSIEANNGDAEAIFSISDNITTGKRGAEVLFKTSNDSIVYETALFISQNDLELSPYAVLTTDSTSVLSNDSTGVTYGKTLTFYYDGQKAERNGMDVGPFTNNLNRGWNDQRENITNVVFDASFANCTTLTSTAFWFHGCEHLTEIVGISNLNTDNVTDMSWMFAFCSSLTSLDVSHFNTQNVTSMFSMFNSCSGLTSLDVSGFKTDNVTNMCNMFIKCSNLTNLNVSNFNTSNVTDISGMFSGCSSLTSLDVSNFNTSNVTNMQYIFGECSGLTSLDVSHFNTENVTYLNGMFSGCSGLTSLDVSGFKTGNVTDMSWLFSGCTGLTSLDLSNFNTSKVTSMFAMFNGSSGLTSLDLSSFNTGNVTSMQLMFSGCTGLTSLDLSNFNTENVTNMCAMFYGCSGLTSLDLSSFNTSNVKYEYDANNYINYSFGIQSMFEGCSALTTIWVGDNWTTANLTESVDVFKDCAALVGGAGTHFDPNHVDYTYAHIDGGTENPGYFTDKNAASITDASVIWAFDTSASEEATMKPKVAFAGSTVTFEGCTEGSTAVPSAGDNSGYTFVRFQPTEETAGMNVRWTANISSGYTFIPNKISLRMARFGTDYGQVDLYLNNSESESMTLATGLRPARNNQSQEQDKYGTDESYTSLFVADIPESFSTSGSLTLTATISGLSTTKQIGFSDIRFLGVVPMSIRDSVCSAPTFSLDGTILTIQTSTPEAQIYYTLDGTNPTRESSIYTQPIELVQNDVVKAIAVRDGWTDSRVSIFTMNLFRVEKPQITVNNNMVSITTSTSGAVIYYTMDGSIPTKTSMLYSDPFELPKNCIVKAIAIREGYNTSYVASYNNLKHIAGRWDFNLGLSETTKRNLKEDTSGRWKYDASTDRYAYQKILNNEQLAATVDGKEWIIPESEGLLFYNDYEMEGRVAFVESSDDGAYLLMMGNYGNITIPEIAAGDSVVITYSTHSKEESRGFEILTDGFVMADGSTSVSSLEQNTVTVYNRNDYQSNLTIAAHGIEVFCIDKSVLEPEPYAVLTTDTTFVLSNDSTGVTYGKTLTFYYDDQKDTRNGMSVGPFSYGQAWYDSSGSITKAVFDASFANCTSLTSTAWWFYQCRKLSQIEGIENLKTDNVTNMSEMFTDCLRLNTLDVTGFNTSNVTDMSGMFAGCLRLNTLDVSNFNTANVTVIGGMFEGCSGLTTLNVSNFKTDNVTNMLALFKGCSRLTSLDVSNFNTANVTDMGYLFYGCSELTTIYASNEWSTSAVTDGESMFYGCEKLVGGKGTVYDASHIDVTYAHIDGGTSNPGYFTDKNAPVIEATFDGRVLAVGGSTTMTDALESVGGRDEVAKTITAIVWNSSATLTNSDLQGLDNPNLLIYVNERSQAPQNRNNVVVNGLAMNVVLSDTGSGNCDFYAPQTFTAEMITYSREFKQATQVGVCRGWETISLPFMVQTIAHADNGVIAPFGVDTSNKHFWLRQLSTNGLVSATKIEANVPYLISMPNDEKNYAKEYILKGLVTFSAENAVVPKTEPTALALADSSVVMMPALQSVGKSSTVWALNVGMERSQYFEGSTFERDYREVRPFEAYTIHRSDTPAPRFLPINDLMNSATGIETISNVIMSHDNYYHLDGRKVDGKPTKKGLYITNGRKVVIK